MNKFLQEKCSPQNTLQACRWLPKSGGGAWLEKGERINQNLVETSTHVPIRTCRPAQGNWLDSKWKSKNRDKEIWYEIEHKGGAIGKGQFQSQMQLQDSRFFSNSVSILFCNSIHTAHNLGNLPQRKHEDCFDVISPRNDPKVLLYVQSLVSLSLKLQRTT